MNNTHNHTIKGVILKDGLVYVPLEEVIKFCKRFPTVDAKHISEVIEQSVKDLLSDTDRLSEVPKIETDKDTPQ